MAVQRYRRKPQEDLRGDQYAARYEPGQPLGDLTAVARMADSDAELAEVTFPSGPVLVVRYERFDDDHPPRIEYKTVEPGRYLAHDPGEGFLYESADGNWQQWYDLVPDGEMS